MKNTLELLAAAVAFADADDHETARRMIDGLDEMRRSSNRKMLLVGLESGFTGRFIDYSVGLAGRLGYDIVALSIFPEKGPDKGQSAGRGRQDKLGLASVLGCLTGTSDRIGKALESCGLLRRRTKDAHLLCAHIVACGLGQKLIEDTCHSIRGIEFAIVQKTAQNPINLDFALPAYFVEC